MSFITLTDSLLVSPQIGVSDINAARDLGVTLIINNRPEGEGDDQTPGADIEGAAQANGIAYVAIPITHSGFSEAQVAAMQSALAGAQGKVLAYCRSGTRSTLLWALSESASGGDPDALTNMAAKAGYDVSSVRPLMDMLKAQG